MTWTPDAITDQSGRTFVITGANSGIGLEAAKVLVAKGARVVLACRSASKAQTALDELRALTPGAKAEVQALDLSNLASVRAFAARAPAEIGPIDALINNAGIMAIPRQLTADGFEMQIGTNHLGHFALTGLLLSLVRPSGRVVHVSSTAHRMGRMNFGDLMGERSYSKWGAYGQSKLSNLLFHHELQRRLTAARSGVISVACHPGYSATNLQHVGPAQEGSAFGAFIMRVGNDWFGQAAAMGAQPTLLAATAPDAQPGGYYGPARMFNMWGPPVKNIPTALSRDAETMRRLWDASVQLTGVDFGGL